MTPVWRNDDEKRHFGSGQKKLEEFFRGEKKILPRVFESVNFSGVSGMPE